MSRRYGRSDASQKDSAVPAAPARAVRPSGDSLDAVLARADAVNARARALLDAERS